MKILNLFAALFFSLGVLQSNAQTQIPAGFKKGSITIADGSMVTGFIKDDIRKKASVTFISTTDAKKKNYDGSDIKTAEIDGVKFICIKGDFFKVLCEGDLSFLQKSSDASGKPMYNGNEAIFLNGTEGKPGDHFIYNNKDKQLKLVSKKNKDEVIAASFSGCKEAIDKAETVKDNLSQLKEAVVLFNNRNK